MEIEPTLKSREGKKTADWHLYMKNYRETNLERSRSVAKINYYKKTYNIDQNFIDTFKEKTLEVCKVKQIILDIKENNAELLAPLLAIISSLTATPQSIATV